MRKNKSMLAKTMFCCLGVGLTMSSLIVPLGVSLFSSNSQPNGLTTWTSAYSNYGIKVEKNRLINSDLKPSELMTHNTVNKNSIDDFLEISSNTLVRIKDQDKFDEFLDRSNGVLDISRLGWVRIIGKNAFSRNEKLKKIILPNSIEKIDKNAFRECSGLTDVNIYDLKNLRSIGESSFRETSLESVVIPESVETTTDLEDRTEYGIGLYAFIGCKEIRKVTFLGNKREILAPSLRIYPVFDLFFQDNTVKEFLFENSDLLEELKSSLKYHGDAEWKLLPSPDEGVGKYFDFKNNILTVKDENGLKEFLRDNGGKLDISELKNVDVIDSGAFVNYSDLKTIVLPVSLKEIGESAFLNCSNLTNVSFSSLTNLNKIGNSVFKGCGNLTDIIIPKSVTEIGGKAFEKCYSLKSVTIPGSVKKIGHDVFLDCKKLVSGNVINNSPVLFDWWVENHLYDGQTMSQMSEINLSQLKNDANKEFNTIGDFAFNKCLTLKKMSISNSVTEIDESAFANCVNLKEVIFQGQNRTISLGNNAFPNTVDYFYFDDNELLNRLCATLGKNKCRLNTDNFVFDASQRVLLGLTLKGKQQKELSIPTSVTKIGSNAFEGSQASIISFGNSKVTEIGDSAFSGCKNIQNISIPATVIQIGEYLFNNCTSLTNVIFLPGSNLKSIPDHSFFNCKNLVEIDIPGSIDNIGELAFGGCNKLKAVTFSGRNRPLSLGKDAFPDSVNYFYFENEGLLNKLCKTLGQDKCRLNDGDFVFNISKVLVGLTETGKRKETLTIPNYVKIIGGSAFAQNEKLRNVIIPESVEKIGTRAFANCSNLISVTFQGNNANLNLGEDSFSGDNNAWYYFEDKGLFDSLKSQFEKAKIDRSKCIFTDEKLFVIDGNNTLTSLTDEGKQQKELKIPNYVTKIGSNAFQGSQAVNIVLSELLTSIENKGFNTCTKLASITIPKSVNNIGANAFGGCTSLTSVTFSGQDRKLDLSKDAFPNNVNYFYFENEGLLNSLCKTLGQDKCRLNDGDFFINASKVLVGLTEAGKQKETLIVPNSVTTIGDSAFAKNEKLRNVIIPESVEKIETRAFADCSKLEGVTFQGNNPNLSLGNGVFSKSVKHFYFENKELFKKLLKSVDAGINEEKCIWVSEFFNVSSKNEQLGIVGLTANGKKQKSLNIPDEAKFIGQEAFNNCENLEEILVNESLIRIGAAAFKNCTNLKKVTFVSSSNLKNIENEAFKNCTNLTDFNIPGQVEEIGTYAFQNCTNLKSINVPNSAIRINDGAFAECENLSTVIFSGNNLELNLGNKVFPKDVKYFYFDDGEFFRKILDKSIDTGIMEEKCIWLNGDLKISSNKGDLWIIGLTDDGQQKSELTIDDTAIGNVVGVKKDAFAKDINLTKITISGSLKTIEKDAFNGCEKLEEIIFENQNLQVIEEGAFSNCKELKSINLPASLTTLGDSVFNGCEKLATVKFDNQSKLQVIGNSAFMNCWNLKGIIIPQLVKSIGAEAFKGCKKLATVELAGNLLEEIGNNAFENCKSLSGITITGSVKNIGEKAFEGCSKLETVTFQGNNLELSLGSEAFPKEVKVFYFETEKLFERFKSSQADAGIDESKCILINSSFQIQGGFRPVLKGISKSSWKLSKLIIPGIVKIIDKGVFNSNIQCETIVIPPSVEVIRAGAFQGCKVKEIIINGSGNILIENGAFDLASSVQYYVTDTNYDIVKNMLESNNISDSQIHSLSERFAKNMNYTLIGIITGAIILSIVALGLGIGIPMHKQHKINVLNSKITQKRIERLSSATALSFKKVLEVSNQTMSDIKTLKEQVKGLPSSPNRISSPERRRPPVVPGPVKPNKPKN